MKYTKTSLTILIAYPVRVEGFAKAYSNFLLEQKHPNWGASLLQGTHTHAHTPRKLRKDQRPRTSHLGDQDLLAMC